MTPATPATDGWVEVALLAPLPALTYAVPAELAAAAVAGRRVRVPLGRRTVLGVVLGPQAQAPIGCRIRPLTQLLDNGPVLPPELLAFLRRAAAYYACPLGLALKTALPQALSGLQPPPTQEENHYRCLVTDPPLRGRLQQELVAFIAERGTVSLTALRGRFAQPHAALRRLEQLGVLVCERQSRPHDPFACQPCQPEAAPALTAAQQQALKAVTAALRAGGFAPFLLHGVTGSGKTEVYLQAIAEVLRQGRQALVLVPEIALTPQLVGRFRARLEAKGARIGVLHSALAGSERYAVWQGAAAGTLDIVIGARSALFVPLARPGILVVDEEQDDSYKQAEGFRYHARDLALLRAQMAAVPVLLGSATPALTSYQRARSGAWHYLELAERVNARPLPTMEIVDLSAVPRAEGPLSPPLCTALAETLQRGEQSLLLLNRRGFAPFLLCQDCGHCPRCPNCDISLTWHRAEGRLRCHYCDYRIVPADCCPVCGGATFEPAGVGTEQLEALLRERFPAARIARMDRDSTRAKGAQQLLVEQMSRRQVDILVGTQMVAKGHDFAAVTLVGIIDADAALNIPDFRAAERSFALLAQVAGRAGRAELPGRVLVQTRCSDHPVLGCALTQDYAAFCAQELPQRQLLGYPPYGYLVNLVLSALDRVLVERHAAALAAALRLPAGVELLGPAPCPLFRLRNRYRLQILLKATERPPLRRLLAQVQQEVAQLPARVRLAIDVDPCDML
ncbi:replication restart helicase PriA [Desulfuromonas thiophila]|uniref:Replication restart protein PriA n=1 Tax=Desulfuromonas thiophila TaxID=57664 RepID=A0A1G7A3I3_9BACT|nr:primosomal protein N' [Desulfuromonas thiophila]SDE09193.1 replication restart DNA helicase PriA [Desulfuromonas thiophila]